MSNKVKVVFLDFDGVLTSKSAPIGSYVNHTLETYGMTDACFDKLVSLCKKTNARVVITSNWRNFEDDGTWSYNGIAFTNPLPSLKTKLGDLYLDTVPPVRHMTKVVAINRWMFEHKYDDSNLSYVIFDDDPNEKIRASKFCDHYIQTDPENGLVDIDIEYAERILNK